MKATDPNASRNRLASATQSYLRKNDTEWFDKTLPKMLGAARGMSLPFPLKLGTESHPDWTKELPQLFATHSFELAALASRIGISQERIATEALRQGIRVPLSNQVKMRLGREKLESILSDLRAGMSEYRVEMTHGVGQWTVRLIELDRPEIRGTRKIAAAHKTRDKHRQRVLDWIASDPSVSRNTVSKRSSQTYRYLLEEDREWFEKTVPRRRRGAEPGSRRRRVNREQFDSELAEKLTRIISELKSESDRPVWITKRGILIRAGCLSKYSQMSTTLPKTQAVLAAHAETLADYRVRKIKWAVAEITRRGQLISGGAMHRKAGLSTALLRQYKPLILQTAQQLGANVEPRSLFARGI